MKIQIMSMSTQNVAFYPATVPSQPFGRPLSVQNQYLYVGK